MTYSQIIFRFRHKTRTAIINTLLFCDLIVGVVRKYLKSKFLHSLARYRALDPLYKIITVFLTTGFATWLMCLIILKFTLTYNV